MIALLILGLVVSCIGVVAGIVSFVFALHSQNIIYIIASGTCLAICCYYLMFNLENLDDYC